jgi:hypothetical protein
LEQASAKNYSACTPGNSVTSLTILGIIGFIPGTALICPGREGDFQDLVFANDIFVMIKNEESTLIVMK